MGTNFYLFTKNKKVVEKYAPYSYSLTDEPDFGYEIHVAKTSAGWLPLFQAHNELHSVRDFKAVYDTGEFKIFSEYGDEYDWNDFEERVLKFNGGVYGVAPRENIKQDKNSMFYDPDLPQCLPISHFEYGNGRYASDYYKDEEGYEFTTHEFS